MKLWVSVFALTLLVGLSAPAQAAFQLVAKDVFEKLDASAESNADVKKACASSKSSNACKTAKSKALFSIYQSNTNALINSLNKESFTPEEYKRINDIQGAWIKELTGKAYSEVLVLQRDRLSLVIDLFNVYERQARGDERAIAWRALDRANVNFFIKSYDTSITRALIEKNICISNRGNRPESALGKCFDQADKNLDVVLNKVWKNIKSVSSKEDFQRTLCSQRRWLKERKDSCYLSGVIKKRSCQAEHTAERSRFLNDILAKRVSTASNSAGKTKDKKSNSTKISPMLLKKQFPLCGRPSSYGQYCKDLTPREAKNHTFASFDEASLKLEDGVLIMETDFWHNRLEIESQSEDEASIIWIDEAKQGTYFVRERLKLGWDYGASNWFIESEELLGISGPKDPRVNKTRCLAYPLAFANGQ